MWRKGTVTLKPHLAHDLFRSDSGMSDVQPHDQVREFSADAPVGSDLSHGLMSPQICSDVADKIRADLLFADDRSFFR